MNSLRVIVTGFVFAFATIASAQISVSSPAFPAGGMIPARFTCKGTNVNPPLQFSGVPQGTKSLALIVDDPDAPGGLFTHWLIWNIDSGTTQLREKSGPAGAVEGTNDFGARGYGVESGPNERRSSARHARDPEGRAPPARHPHPDPLLRADGRPAGACAAQTAQAAASLHRPQHEAAAPRRVALGPRTA